MKIGFDKTKRNHENWSFQEGKDKKIIECLKDGKLDDDDELFRRAYWIKDWHIMIMTNERILILDTDLNILKGLGQFVADFEAVAY